MVMYHVARLIICTCIVVLSGCTRPVVKGIELSPASEVPMPENARLISFSWKPNMTAADFQAEPLAAYKQISMAIAAVTDSRQDVRVIGKTLEDKKIQDIFVPLVTKSNVAKWALSSFHKTLQLFSLTVDEKKAQLRLEVELLEFGIEDNITQIGRAEFRVTATTATELLIWEGKISGSSDLYYRPKDSDGISECLSNTILVTMHNLLTEQSFRDAVVKAFEPE